ELLEGEALDERCERKGGHLPVNEVLAVADQLLDVLAVAHDKGIVHRDLKPENLFLTHSGVLKVLDFGIARLDALSTSSSTTRAGALLGTPAFMAPEQARGRWEEVDARTDLWAVGATMFSLLTGRMVHDAETPNEALALAITQPPPPISQLLPDLHVCVAALVDRALRYCKDERFQNAREMQQAVCQAYGEVSAAAPARPPMPSIYDSGIRCVDARGADGDVLPSALVNRVSGMVTTVTLASSAARSGSTSLTPRSTRSRAWGVIARTALIVAVVGVAAYRGGSRDGEAKARAQESSKGLPQAAGQSEKHMSVSAGTSPVVREAASTSNPANCQGVTSVQFAPGGAGADAPSAGAREQGAAPRKRAARAAGVAEDPFAKRH
ncbi:MAG TPA: serine/threonine-protein kinase, partial [Polyangiaceae bacterium]